MEYGFELRAAVLEIDDVFDRKKSALFAVSRHDDVAAGVPPGHLSN
jgi:hypothetical protein